MIFPHRARPPMTSSATPQHGILAPSKYQPARAPPPPPIEPAVQLQRLQPMTPIEPRPTLNPYAVQPASAPDPFFSFPDIRPPDESVRGRRFQAILPAPPNLSAPSPLTQPMRSIYHRARGRPRPTAPAAPSPTISVASAQARVAAIDRRLRSTEAPTAGPFLSSMMPPPPPRESQEYRGARVLLDMKHSTPQQNVSYH